MMSGGGRGRYERTWPTALHTVNLADAPAPACLRSGEAGCDAVFPVRAGANAGDTDALGASRMLQNAMIAAAFVSFGARALL